MVQQALSRYHLDSQEPEVPLYKMTLADCYYNEGNVIQALPLLEQTIRVWTNQQVQPFPAGAAVACIDLAEIYRLQKNYQQAAETYRAGEQLLEETSGADNGDLPRHLLNLAWLYEKAGDYTQSRSQYLKAWSISAAARGTHNPEIAIILYKYSNFLWRTNNFFEALVFKIRAQVLRS